ncbi:MAG: PilZ domain-containing protein [Syntrophobacteraceae bacterium]
MAPLSVQSPEGLPVWSPKKNQLPSSTGAKSSRNAVILSKAGSVAQDGTRHCWHPRRNLDDPIMLGGDIQKMNPSCSLWDKGGREMERRRFTRVQVRTLAVIKSRFVEVKGEVQDLSLNGVRLKTAQKFDIGKDVQIRLSFTSDCSNLWVEIFGVVIRHEDTGLVIQFSNMSLDSYVNLRNMIAILLNDECKVLGETLIYITGNSIKGLWSDLEIDKSLNNKVEQHITPHHE